MSDPASAKQPRASRGKRGRVAVKAGDGSTSVKKNGGSYVIVTYHGEPAVENVVPVGALDFAPVFVTP